MYKKKTGVNGTGQFPCASSSLAVNCAIAVNSDAIAKDKVSDKNLFGVVLVAFSNSRNTLL
jgi:predicted ABC-type ATPase